MRQGTTPTHTFTTDYDCSGAELIYITYCQNDETVLEIDSTSGRITADAESISVKLTQEETLLFSPDRAVLMQIRAKMPGGDDADALISNIMMTDVMEALKQGVI